MSKELNDLWDEFLEEWPAERVALMSLEDYCRSGSADTFIGWLEIRTERMGSIAGGFAFKFGIYHRSNTVEKEAGSGRVWGKEYAWFSKYGESEAEAFEEVRGRLVAIVEAAQHGDLAAIDEIDFSEAVKWKIAFLYQSRDEPKIIPIFKRKRLRELQEASGVPAPYKTPMSAMYTHLMKQKVEGEDIFDLGERLWKQTDELGSPFDRMFSAGNADQVLDVFKLALETIDDELGGSRRVVAVTLGTKSRGVPRLVISVGIRAVLFYSPGRQPAQMTFVLRADHPEVERHETVGMLAGSTDGAGYCHVGLPLEEFFARQGELWPAIEEAIRATCRSFGGHQGSAHLRHHRPVLVEMIEDPKRRPVILREGLGTRTEARYWLLDEADIELEDDGTSGRVLSLVHREGDKLRPDEEPGDGVEVPAVGAVGDVLGLKLVFSGGHYEVKLAKQHKDGSFVVEGKGLGSKGTFTAGEEMLREIAIKRFGAAAQAVRYRYNGKIETFAGTPEVVALFCESRAKIHSEVFAIGEGEAIDAGTEVGIRAGDVIVLRRGMFEVSGWGIVTGMEEADAENHEDAEDAEDANEAFVWKLDWRSDEVHRIDGLAEASMVDVTDDTAFLTAMARAYAGFPIEAPSQPQGSYSMADALTELFIEKDELIKIERRLREKKNIILQGAPGVGKTFMAERLAYLLMGEKDEARVEMVQFHQSYSYEDFVQGIRPSMETGGFEVKNGIFHRFCARAAADPDRAYVMVIDEINRGNLGKILGELMMLIEPDKRGKKLSLSYSGEAFGVPRNVYLIGTMNTADRSLSMVDYALRRRFSFITLEPGFGTQAFADHLERMGVTSAQIERIRARMAYLNAAIVKDSVNLGAGYRVGHSYFTPTEVVAHFTTWCADIMEHEIVPLVEEYWMDDLETAAVHREKLLEA